jgi:hypothetical protein
MDVTMAGLVAPVIMNMLGQQTRMDAAADAAHAAGDGEKLRCATTTLNTATD